MRLATHPVVWQVVDRPRAAAGAGAGVRAREQLGGEGAGPRGGAAAAAARHDAVDISPNRPMRIVGEVVEDGGDGLEPLAERFARPQSLLTKPLSNKQKSCYSKVCRKCWQECNEGMGTCVASPGYALPGSVCTRVWNKQSDCSNSIKAFEVGGGSEYLNRDNKYHFAVAAWSQCAHGLTPNGRPW